MAAGAGTAAAWGRRGDALGQGPARRRWQRPPQRSPAPQSPGEGTQLAAPHAQPFLPPGSGAASGRLCRPGQGALPAKLQQIPGRSGTREEKQPLMGGRWAADSPSTGPAKARLLPGPPRTPRWVQTPQCACSARIRPWDHHSQNWGGGLSSWAEPHTPARPSPRAWGGQGCAGAVGAGSDPPHSPPRHTPTPPSPTPLRGDLGIPPVHATVSLGKRPTPVPRCCRRTDGRTDRQGFGSGRGRCRCSPVPGARAGGWSQHRGTTGTGCTEPQAGTHRRRPSCQCAEGRVRHPRARRVPPRSFGETRGGVSPPCMMGPSREPPPSASGGGGLSSGPLMPPVPQRHIFGVQGNPQESSPQGPVDPGGPAPPISNPWGGRARG